jgi:hypothetical protein
MAVGEYGPATAPDREALEGFLTARAVRNPT